MPEQLLNGRIELHCGDCLDVLAQLEECSIDSCVTDPPYHLTSIVKRFGAEDAVPAMSTAQRRFAKTGGADRMPGPDQYGRLGRGFMGKVWDGGDIAFDPATWRAVYRVLKPGAHACVFTIPKHIGFVQIAMQQAGFEFRDVICWLFGVGFPKSLDISKAIDRAAGAERSIIGERELWGSAATGGRAGQYANGEAPKADGSRKPLFLTVAATDAARQWEGWGTALKPACELIVLARKPLSEGTVAANVLKWGTGAINVDGCRIHADDAQGGNYTVTRLKPGATLNKTGGNWRPEDGGIEYNGEMKPGRWPANVVHDGSDEVVAGFPETSSGELLTHHQRLGGGLAGSSTFAIRERTGEPCNFGGDTGSAARFFYTAKADADDRLGSKHPTVKPLDLMQWLVRLVTPPRGLVLDPFAGTGTTGEAAWREGFSAVLIEAEAEYQADIRRRMALALAGPDERARESIKAKNLPRDDGPLFGGTDRQQVVNRQTYGEFAKHWGKPIDYGPLFEWRETAE